MLAAAPSNSSTGHRSSLAARLSPAGADARSYHDVRSCAKQKSRRAGDWDRHRSGLGSGPRR